MDGGWGVREAESVDAWKNRETEREVEGEGDPRGFMKNYRSEGDDGEEEENNKKEQSNKE